MDRVDELITLVLHSEEHAYKLKEILEFHNIAVTLEKIDVEGLPLQETPLKVRIPVNSLPLGLKILESGEITSSPLTLAKMTGVGNTLLIPVDFSPMSLPTVKLGFSLAEKFNVEPVVLHTYIAPSYVPDNGDVVVNTEYEDEFADNASQMDAVKLKASQELLKFKKIIVEAQKSGELADVRFSTSLIEGIPEQVIQEYCKANKPAMVVMATRGIHKKGLDLIGSVTAEVIDSCRVPVVTVPENYQPSGIFHTKRIVMFCNFAGFDTLVVRWFMRAFDYPTANFYLMAADDRPATWSERKLSDLQNFFSKTYPTATFEVCNVSNAGFDDSVKNLIEKENIELMIVPNKKSSALSRFFKPTLAHRILFEKDIPLVVIPVK